MRQTGGRGTATSGARMARHGRVPPDAFSSCVEPTEQAPQASDTPVFPAARQVCGARPVYSPYPLMYHRCALLCQRLPSLCDRYSRSRKNLARQLSHHSYKSAFTGSQRPICESGATVGVRGFSENGCTFSIPHVLANELPSEIVRAACSLLVHPRSRVSPSYISA